MSNRRYNWGEGVDPRAASYEQVVLDRLKVGAHFQVRLVGGLIAYLEETP